MNKAEIDLDFLIKSKEYSIKTGDKEYRIRLIAIKDLKQQEEHPVTPKRKSDEFPGFGAASHYVDIPEEEFREVRKSVTKNLEL